MSRVWRVLARVAIGAAAIALGIDYVRMAGLLLEAPRDPYEVALAVVHLVGAGLIGLGLDRWRRGRRADARLAWLIAGACGLLPMWPYGLGCMVLAVLAGWGVRPAAAAAPAAPPARRVEGSGRR